MPSKKHTHIFFALWCHFGPYRQSYEHIHYHPCHDIECDRVLVGKGWDCDGKKESHHRETLKEP